MQFPSFIRPLAQSLGALLLILTCNASAFGADTYYRSNQQLTIPLLRIGDANYSNTVVTIGSVVSLQGGSPNGSEDTYNPATNQLTVPSVMAGGTHYYNAVGTVGHLVSIGGVGGADTYNGTKLAIPYVEVVGGSIYTNAVITVGRILSVYRGMPTNALDQYDPKTKILSIPTVLDQLTGNIYTNVIITVGQIDSVGGTASITYSVIGRVQKGPFTVGSEITINALDSTLSSTGVVYNTQTIDAMGDFSQTNIDTQLVELVAQGFYIDELTGQLSASEIQLRSISDLSVNSAPTVNVLTTLQEQRLKFLVSQGSTVASASAQSQSEVLALFGINTASINSLSTSDSMRIDGTSDEDAVLLAVSAILSQMATDAAKANGTTEAAEFSNLVNTIAAGIASSGTLSSTTLGPAKNIANTEISAATVTNNLQNYYANNGISVTAPLFIEWVDQSNSGILPQRLLPVTGLEFAAASGVCPDQSITSGSVTISGVAPGVVVPIEASAGATIIKNGVAVLGQFAIAQNGDTIELQITSAGYDITTTANFTAGSTSTTWQVTSAPLGGSISGLNGTGLILQLNGGNDIAIPAGSSSFSFSVPLANGASYILNIGTQPTSPLEVCDLSNASGTVGQPQGPVSVTCASPSLMLVAAPGLNVDPAVAGSVSVYTIDPVSGVLTLVYTVPFETGLDPYSIAIDPSGNFVYVPEYGSDVIAAYSISPATGGLQAISGSPFISVPSTAFLTFAPSGDFIYAPSIGGSSVAAFSMNPTSGALTTVTGSPFASGAGPVSVTISPNGKFAYLNNESTGSGSSPGSVSAYTIDPASGTLTAVAGSPFATGIAPETVTIDPTGSFAYVSNTVGGISAFAINSSTGALTPIAGSPFAAGGATIYPVTISPNGLFAYVANQGANSVYGFTIDSVGGSLTPMVGNPFTAGSNPHSVNIDPSGNFAYVADNPGISAYTIDPATGALTPIAGSPFLSGADPITLIFDQSGKFAYAANYSSNSISAYAFNSVTGFLSPIAGSPFPTGNGPIAIVTIPLP